LYGGYNNGLSILVQPNIPHRSVSVWLLVQNVIKHTPAPAGRQKKGEGGRCGREACTVAAKM